MPYDIEAKRLALRDNLNADEVKKRIGSQMPLEKKTKLADFVQPYLKKKRSVYYYVIFVCIT
ncbi:MAG: dephospho-CoA kinase [Endomicrobium sp.]|nr:dephospho-CoA kinase [Endomicrobium sp.]